MHGDRFHTRPSDARDKLLRRMQMGELKGEAWGGMPCKLFFEHRVIADVTHAYYAHPIAWNEIGFGGPASLTWLREDAAGPARPLGSR